MVNDLVGKLVADKYRVESLIREGEMGDLYSARHEIMDRPVTMKILPPALAVDSRWTKRFIEEARAASAISHSNILNLTDFGTDSKGIAYAVFDHTDGRTLRDLMAAELSFDEIDALAITREIAAAVNAAHSRKAIHGHLSPRNIFIDAEGDEQNVRVFGFGADTQTVSRDAEPQYLAHEQLTNFPITDERSDVYAVGVIFYEMLSGVVPFDGATAAEVAAKQGTEPPPPLSAFRRDIHPEIEPIVLTAIAADPERRYQTIEAFSEDLDILAGRVGLPTTTAAAVATAATASPKRNIWQTAFIALAGISLLAAALIYATSGRGTDPTAVTQVDAASLPVQPIGPATGALEDNLAKQGPMSTMEAEMLANSNMAPMDMLPGGDGYNAWANSGLPPAGAPLGSGIPPGGQVYTIDPNGGSQFMPGDPNCVMQPSGLLLCYEQVPANTAPPSTKPVSSPTPKPEGTPEKTSPPTQPTPKPLATPPPKDKPSANTPTKTKPKTESKGGKSGQPKSSE